MTINYLKTMNRPLKEGFKGDHVPFIKLTKRQRYVLKSLKDKQKIYVQTFVNFDYYELCDLLKPLFKYFKRKGSIEWISLKYRYNDGVINEVCFPYCLKYLYATISKILYDYDYFICLNYPPFGITQPKIKIVSLIAHALEGKTNRSDFILECKRLGRIKY